MFIALSVLHTATLLARVPTSDVFESFYCAPSSPEGHKFIFLFAILLGEKK